jgi:hypothetical protein
VTIASFNRFSALIVVASLGAGCAAAPVTEDAELSADRQAFVDSINGMPTINGLTTNNGLKTVNGLTTKNGLKTVNGLMTINGLRTMNGLATINGLSVDCTGRTAGVDCTGTPDGLLSADTGLMSSDDGITTAKYLVRCALPKGQSLRIQDYTGGLVTLSGEIGFAPEWATGQCDATCQEQVSACLMALTNGKGEHVEVELSSPDSAVGAGHSYPYQEAVFFGNVFADSPKTNFCVGKDFSGVVIPILGITLGEVMARACAGYYSAFGTNSTCPFADSGTCNAAFLDLFGTTGKCTFSNGAATACAPKGSTTKSWKNPVTTYRKTK